MSKTGFQWVSDTLTKNMSDAGPRAAQYMARLTAYHSLRSETYAKTKAKWTDRTGNARSGLSSTWEARINTGGTGEYRIDVFHRVPYGFWLEVRWGGRYAIISKTIEYNGEKFMRSANDLFARMFGGS